jgi:hypothetical protein
LRSAEGLWLSSKFMERTWREMRDIIRTERLDEKWDTTADTILTRLGGRTHAEATAVLRAAIRFWERHEEPTATLLRDLGLISSAAARTSEGHREQKETEAVDLFSVVYGNPLS